MSSGIALANESSVQAYMSLAATSLDITISESISMNSDGTTENLMVSDLVVKSNMDLGVVNVTDISVNAENGWTLVKKGTDFISMNADSQQIYLGYSTHDFSKGSLKINDFEVAPGESKALSLSAKTGPIKTDISNQKVATVILTAELDHITWVDLGENLGEVAVENGDDLTFEVNEETGTILGSTKEPLETIPPVLPDEAIPTLIEFNGGYFDLKSNYVSSRYETVTYTKTETAPKEPVTYDWGLICSWHFDENYNIYPGNSSLQDVDFDSTYIVYVKYDAVSADGVPTSGLEYYSIKNENDDTLENAVYLAAYLIKTGKSSDFDIAMWDGTEYVDLNKQDEIAAVDTFTYSYEVTAEKTVQVSNPSSSTEHVYIPTETMQAEENMTWEEWLSSSYNLTGLTGSEAGFVLKDSDYNDVALTSEIAADGSYAMYIANLDPGLYDAEGTMLASWDTLVNDYGMDVEKNYSDQSIHSNCYQNVTSSPYNVLKNFSGATKLVMGKGIGKIGSIAFAYQNELEVIELPEGVTTIGYKAFSQSGLKSVSIPEGITTIGEDAFAYCDITTIKISDSVTTIGVNAFYSNNLTTIKIPSSVTSIGAAAFGSNINLTSITVSDTNPAYSSENGILFNKDKTTLILYPTGRTGSYTIPNTVTS
ncbi:MAG: leucine-rich repeat domain-containing protein, partial [Firmicutes bacterium]|nr:leucine-rich repeat domain-containing protein [Bacillota bacterium]